MTDRFWAQKLPRSAHPEYIGDFFVLTKGWQNLEWEYKANTRRGRSYWLQEDVHLYLGNNEFLCIKDNTIKVIVDVLHDECWDMYFERFEGSPTHLLLPCEQEKQ